MVDFFIPTQTRNPSNSATRHSRIASILHSKENRAQRDMARAFTVAALRKSDTRTADLLPAVVTLTRWSSGRLDAHDGLPAALKRVVDGIALALGIDDGGPLVAWQYAQKKVSPKVFGVWVQIERAQVDGKAKGGRLE